MAFEGRHGEDRSDRDRALLISQARRAAACENNDRLVSRVRVERDVVAGIDLEVDDHARRSGLGAHRSTQPPSRLRIVAH